jgi:hypothetical protein
MWYKRHYLVPLHGVSTAVLPLLKFQPSYVAVRTLLMARSSFKIIDIVMLPAFTVLGSKVLFLQALKPRYRRVVLAQVELLSIQVLMEMFQCAHCGK